MKKLIYITFAFCLLFCTTYKGFMFGQNLVPNHSFEEYSQCPDTFSQFLYSNGWLSFRNSPDYYNSCSPSSNFSVPNNWGGIQPASNGNSYCGIYTYHLNAPNLREYVGIQLVSPLSVGKKYSISFDISLLDSLNYATNNMGALFSTVFFTDGDGTNPATTSLLNFSHIKENEMITDTISWFTISGDFIADSAYQFIAIGNFYDDASTQIVKVRNFSSPILGSDYAYYFVDNIVVQESGLGLKNIDEFVLAFSQENKILQISTNELYSEFDINIYNLLGEKVYSEKFNENKIKIDLSSLTLGQYFLTIKNQNNLATKKFLITN